MFSTFALDSDVPFPTSCSHQLPDSAATSAYTSSPPALAASAAVSNVKRKYEGSILEDVAALRSFRERSPKQPIDEIVAFYDDLKHSQTENFAFAVLLSGIVGTQNHDKTTIKAMKALIRHCKNGVLSPMNILTSHDANETAEEAIASTIKFCNYFRNKSKYILKLAEEVRDLPAIPKDLDKLVKLPGIGPKIAHMTLDVAFDIKQEGITVDTHVHRISQRIGWVTENKNPDITRRQLQEILPEEYWSEITVLLIALGQSVCTNKNPSCAVCPLKFSCVSSSYSGRPQASSSQSGVYIDDKAAMEKAIALSLKESGATLNESVHNNNARTNTSANTGGNPIENFLDIENCAGKLSHSSDWKQSDRKLSMDEDHFTMIIQEEVMRRVAEWEHDESDVAQFEKQQAERQVNKIYDKKEEAQVIKIVSPMVHRRETEEYSRTSDGENVDGMGIKPLVKSKKRRAFGHSILKNVEKDKALKSSTRIDHAESTNNETTTKT